GNRTDGSPHHPGRKGQGGRAEIKSEGTPALEPLNYQHTRCPGCKPEPMGSKLGDRRGAGEP
ncbi:MAG: hypothetical protein ACOC90_04725, partial [Bacteroidota bacterium]